MTCLVDVTVLLGAAEPTWPGHAACRALMENLRKRPEPWYLTWQILYELYGYGTDSRVLEKPWRTDVIHSYVQGLQRSRSLCMLVETPQHAKIVQDVLKRVPGVRGELFQHLHVAALMREHGVERIYTTDPRFGWFDFLDVVNPGRVGEEAVRDYSAT